MSARPRSARVSRTVTILSGLALAATLGACSVSQSISQDDLEEKVAGEMDELTGTTFPVECDGDLEGTVDETQRCWRIIDGLADQGVPDGSRLGITVTVTSVGDEAQINIQADDEVTAPE